MPEKRILLVEDDEDVGEVLMIALLGAGYAVDFATTAAEAWRHLAAHRYAMVLSDWRLPDGDGSVIADGGAELGAKTFIMSGFLPEMPLDRREGHQCMMKPVRIDDLLAIVETAIGAPGGK
ncbi:MAG TPA: response regulator [Stellaceae bacterium]|jgi:DNA-binding response OmpR family regulator|nr:response regulator [Stellaceae bacterium]